MARYYPVPFSELSDWQRSFAAAHPGFWGRRPGGWLLRWIPEVQVSIFQEVILMMNWVLDRLTGCLLCHDCGKIVFFICGVGFCNCGHKLPEEA